MRLRLFAALAVALGFFVAVQPSAHAVNDPGIPQQWGLSAIGAQEAWAIGSGVGITIAVVDTGVDPAHEEFQGNLVPGKNFVDPSKPPLDDHGHGTHVAGIAAAVTNNGRGVSGVAPDAKIMPVKVLNREGRSTTFNGESSVDAGIKWAADNGAHVINLSLGDAGITAGVFSPSFADAVDYAWQKGAISVVSAGNSGQSQNPFVTESRFGDRNVLVVTSLARNGTKPAYASGTGTAKYGIAAPGGAADKDKSADDILSSWWMAGRPNTYAFVAGTSMAAPHVAGAVAVLRSLGMSRDQALARIVDSARDLGEKGDDNTYGNGALDMKAAVAGLKPNPGPSVTTTTTAPRSSSRPPRPGAPTTTSVPGVGDTTTTTTTFLETVDTPPDLTGDGDGDGTSAAAADDVDDGAPGDDRPWLWLTAALLSLGGVATLFGRLLNKRRPGPL